VQLPELPELPEVFDRRWVRIATPCGILLVVALLTTFFVVRYLESSTAGCECEGLVDHARLELYNPFRDRVPERLGETAMRAIQAHQCQGFPGAAIYCTEEAHLTILSWKLTGAVEDKHQSSAVVRFWVVRSAKPGEPFEDPLWMTLRRNGESWRVTEVETYY
jgi:hypothetical protein